MGQIELIELIAQMQSLNEWRTESRIEQLALALIKHTVNELYNAIMKVIIGVPLYPLTTQAREAIFIFKIVVPLVRWALILTGNASPAIKLRTLRKMHRRLTRLARLVSHYSIFQENEILVDTLAPGSTPQPG